MKRIFITLAIAILLSAVQAGTAQTRIQFAKGKSSATVKGSTGEYGVTYAIRAKSGQKIVLTLTPRSGVGIKVETEGTDGQQVLLREETGGTHTVYLEEGGDFTIFVGSISGKSLPFTLTVAITKMTDI